MYANGLYLGNLQPSWTPRPCIDVFDNVFPDPHEAIRSVEEENQDPNSMVSWSPSSTDHGVISDYRTSRNLSLTEQANHGSQACQNIHNQFYTLLVSSVGGYLERYKISGEIKHESYGMLKYSTSEGYKSHYDSGVPVKRDISAILYLNDDYEGGELRFDHLDLEIKPTAGSLILFPSNFTYRHTALNIVSGTKYALVTWMSLV